jgi:thymidylate synthase
MNNLDKQYTALLQDILDNGVKKDDRTGTGTLSVFGRHIRHKMSDGFPLLTTKKVHFKSVVTELLWFLRGDTNIKYLVDNDCHIWDGDAYQSYCRRYCELDERDKIEYGSSYYNHEINEYEFEYYSKEEFVDYIKTNTKFAKKWGELGPIYGAQWRSWETGDLEAPRYEHWKKDIDQIQNLIRDLKTNPDSRRLMVNAWNVGELDQMVLPPCHYGFQVYTKELTIAERIKWVMENTDVELENLAITERAFHESTPQRSISLMWNQRSVDTFLGLPFNIASYGLLLEIIAKMVNMVPDQLVGSLGDTHLYLNHLNAANEQIGYQYSLDERRKMVTQEMFNEIYNGGDPSTLSHSEIDQWGIPRVKDREAFYLPKLEINSGNENWHLLELDEIINTFDPDITFKVKGYKSHPSIKAPLSN